MPSAGALSPEQTTRRAAVLDVLTGAGWTPDTALWDAGITTDFVASAQLRRFGAAQRCDYIISSGDGLSEYLHVRWNLPEGEFELIVDFLGLTCGGPEADLDAVLEALRFGQEQDADDWVPATLTSRAASSSGSATETRITSTSGRTGAARTAKAGSISSRATT